MPPSPDDTGRPDHRTLRPRDLGGLLSAAWHMYREHWEILISITAAAVIPLAIFLSLLAAADSLVVQGVATLLGVLLVTPLVTAALIKAAADLYLGDTPALGGSYAYAFARFLPLLGAVVMAALGILLGFVLLIVPGLILTFRWYFVAQVVVVEDAKATDAIARSWRLSKGHFWRIVAVVVVATLVAAVVAGVVAFPFSFGSPAVQTVGEVLAQVVVQPFVSLIGVLLYFDLRVRGEAFTAETLTGELGS